jgi:chromosome segregation ATPase
MDREARNRAMAVQDLARQHAARGFTAPSGAMLAQIQAAQQASLEKLSSASRDIALKRADMYVDNRKFTLQQVKELEQILIGYYSAMQERALNSAKAVVELGVAVFNAQAARLRLLNERAALKLQVFEAQLKAQLAHLDEYKAQAEVARVSAEVQRIQVEVYKAQVDAAMSSVNLYKAQMEGAQTAAQIENLKLQGFKAQVDTYTAQVGAYEAQFRAYESQIRGEASKVQAFAAQVDGYKAQVEAVTAKTQGQVAGMDAQLKPMMFRLEKYRAQVERYRADLQYDLQNMERLSKDWGLQMGAQKMLADVNMKNSEAQMWAAKASADVATSRASVAAQVAIASAHQSATVANGIAGVNATLAATYANAASSISSGISSLGVEITST